VTILSASEQHDSGGLQKHWRCGSMRSCGPRVCISISGEKYSSERGDPVYRKRPTSEECTAVRRSPLAGCIWRLFTSLGEPDGVGLTRIA